MIILPSLALPPEEDINRVPLRRGNPPAQGVAESIMWWLSGVETSLDTLKRTLRLRSVSIYLSTATPSGGGSKPSMGISIV
jgi:hypothetical protein